MQRWQPSTMTSVPPSESGLLDESDPKGEGRLLQVLFDGLPALIGFWDTTCAT
jgi:hypothetical protein